MSGAGSAGSIGGGAVAFLGARLAPGSDRLLDLVRSPSAVARAEQVVIGEVNAAGFAYVGALAALEPDLERCPRDAAPLLTSLAQHLAETSPSMRGLATRDLLRRLTPPTERRRTDP